MATYTDVTQPVIVNIAKTTQFKSDNYLRRMAIVSDGNSTLTQGEYTTLTSDIYTQYITADTETMRQASNFFSAAGSNKELVLIEVGNTSLATMCSHLKNFIDGEELKCFNYILPSSFYNVKRAAMNAVASITSAFTCNIDNTQRMMTQLRLMNFSKAQYPITITFSKDGMIDYDVYTGIYSIADNTGITPMTFKTLVDTYTFVLNSADLTTSLPNGVFDTNIDALTFTCYSDKAMKTTTDKLTVDWEKKTVTRTADSTENDFPVYIKITDDNGENATIGQIVVNFNETSPVASDKIDYTRKGTTIVEQFPITATLTDATKSQKICDIIFNHADMKAADKQETQICNYSASFYGEDLSFVTLATTYSALDSEVYFFLPIEKTEDPNISITKPYYDGLKAIMSVQENVTKDSQNLTGSIVGITASSFFTYSTSMPASSLNYKATSCSPFGYTKAMKKSLINAPITFCDELASQNVILNGRMRDGKPWDYYFNWSYINYSVTDKLTQLILNGQNNPNSAVRFNQDGIDKIHTTIVAKLQDMVSVGALTAFAQSYDTTTGSFTGQNDIYVPEFYAFVADNPTDYENEIFSGISCYLQIGKFIRQIVWNVTLG